MSGETQPVAWRVKDSSGGWMICSETAAKLLIERNSALIEPLYSADALASRDAEIGRLSAALGEAERALEECANDLEAEISARASGELPRRIARDLETVTRARAALSALKTAREG